MNVKSARIRLGAAAVLFFLWVAGLAAMAVYSANRPPERIVRPMPDRPDAEPADLDDR